MTAVSAEARIFARVTAPAPATTAHQDVCWEWQGYRMPAGHGRVRVGRRKVLVHRWVWELFHGPIPEGLSLDHLCRNPPCCNPEHLDPVPHRVNVLRGIGQGALNAAKTECPKGHPYDEVNTYLDYLGRRVCRTCRREWQRAWRANRPQAARDGGTGCPGTTKLDPVVAAAGGAS